MNRDVDANLRRLILQEASEWFLLLRSADPAPDVHVQFNAWCAADPRHLSAYRRIAAAWGVVGANATAPEIQGPRRDALNHVQRLRNDRVRGHGLRAWVAGFATAATCLVLLIWGIRLWQMHASVQVYETGIGETRELPLPDGSRITLDAESRVAVAYSARVRLVELLEGQGYFDVAKDPIRLFQVRVDNDTVVAHGTAFNVERREDEVFITLVEGRVTVVQGEDAPAASQLKFPSGVPVPVTHELMPGEQLIIKKNGQPEPRRNVGLEQVTAWRRGKVFLNEEPLSEACIRINKYSRVKVLVQDRAIASLDVSGVFHAGDTRAFIEAVGTMFALKAVPIGNDSILLVRAE